MLTGIGAPTAWPFLQSNPVHLTPPKRTALGTVIDGTGTDTVWIGGINLAANDTLLVATGNDGYGAFGAPDVDIDGTALSRDVIQDDTGGAIVGALHRYYTAVAIVGGTITAFLPGGSVAWFAMLMCKVTSLTGIVNETQSAGFGITADPGSGATGVYLGNGFHWGLVVTNGKNTDALGAWQISMTAGQRVSGGAGGGSKLDLKEGYRIINGQQAEAKILGQGARASAALVGNYGA